MKRLISYILNVIVYIFFSFEATNAQEYTIGPEDVLSITFWQQPELNTTVRVSQNGTIVLPVIGSMTAASLTPMELATKIVEKISLFNQNISQASVVVTQYGSKKIYVTGQVSQPGKYAFETIPNLWKIILEAGGPTTTSDLSQVKVIRGGTETGRILTVNLVELLKKGEMSKLPPIYPDDTINIPERESETIGTNAGTVADMASGALDPTTPLTQVEKKIIYLYGQIVRPGGYPLNQELDLLEAIILAGGPTTIANLSKVRVITRGKPYSSIATINLENYSKSGIPAPFFVKPGDTIFIPRKRTSPFGNIFQRGNIIYDVLRILVTATTSYLIYNLIQ